MFHRTRVAQVLFFTATMFTASPGSVAAEEATVFQSAREIPLAYSVDVVVVGGSTHAVALAAEVSEQGASVFLAAPRPYLGEDLVDTLSLRNRYDEPNSDLEGAIFGPLSRSPSVPSIPYRYKASRPSSAQHRDTDPPTLLSNGHSRDATRDSVQFDGDVTLSLRLEGRQPVDHLTLIAFERSGHYGIDHVKLAEGGGGAIDDRATQATGRPWSRIEMTVPVDRVVDRLDLNVQMRADCQRILLGELIIHAPVASKLPAVNSRPPIQVTTPYRVKSVLDQHLLEAGVTYLHGCYATNVLVDAQGRLAGIVMANRAGRQAVVAKMVVDATPRSAVAEMARVESRPWPNREWLFHHATLRQGPAGEPLTKNHRLSLTLPDASFPSLAGAEQDVRDQTFTDDQVRSAASLSYVPPDPVRCQKSAADFSANEPIDTDHFRAQGRDRLIVLSARADIPRDAAGKLLEPCGLVPVGERLGRELGSLLPTISAPENVTVLTSEPPSKPEGDIREVLQGIRSTSNVERTIPSPDGGLAVLGRYDVVVIGGGTGGAAAGIAAARQGARTLVVEYQDGLGGVGTLGMIGKAYHGRAVGFAAEVPFPNKKFSIEQKMEWYRRQLRSAGADIWFGTVGCGAYVQESRVLGAVVATPQGHGVVLARTTIDATGNADIAVAAGADWIHGANASDIASQGAGLPTRQLDAFYTNSDYLLVDESDMLDVWRTLVGTKQTMPQNTFDAGSLIQTRERRRVVGDHRLTYLDQVAGRTYPDSIVFSGSDYDSHGYPTSLYFALLPHDEASRTKNHPAPGGTCYTPYRCLLPRGLERLLVIGLGISMDRDASAMVRMQLDISNQGYAAGVAAALAAQEGIAVRAIDVRRLQRHLVDTGALPEEVLTHDDNFPLSQEQIASAVRSLADATNPRTATIPLAIVLSHQDSALGYLRSAYNKSAGPKRLVYARVLGMLGDATGVDELIESLEEVTTWDEKILQGKMAEYAHLPTPVDSLILALGSTGDRRALGPILDKLAMLDAGTTLSHHRAVALALERLGDPAAAEPLAQLLRRPGMRGHVMRSIEPLHNSQRALRRRTGPLREIVWARVLYRLGDHERLGETILREYAEDIRGLFVRHATAVLESDR